MPGIPNKWVKTPTGPRPHVNGDNQIGRLNFYPSWQRDRIGTDGLFAGKCRGNEQQWRLWEFPHIWHDDFHTELVRHLGG